MLLMFSNGMMVWYKKTKKQKYLFSHLQHTHGLFSTVKQRWTIVHLNIWYYNDNTLFSIIWTSKDCRPGAVASEIVAKMVAVPVPEAKVAKWVEDQARMGPCDSLGWGGGAKGTAAAPACRSCSSEPVLHKRARNPYTIYYMASSLPTLCA